jgi:hypothetical protein
MRDEIGHIRTLGQLPGIRRRRIEHHNGRAGFHLIDKAMRDLADEAIGHGHHHHVGVGERFDLFDAVDAERRPKSPATLFGDLDMGNSIGRPLQICGEAEPHLSAGTE